MHKGEMFELNRDVSEKKFLRWRVLGRVALFFLGCAVVLTVTVPLTHKLAGPWQSLVVGTIASLGVFALTLVFVHWERFRLDDVGAALSRRSLPRFVFGFFLGMLLVALFAAILAVASHLRWVRSPEVGFGATAVSLLTYIALSCREELAFRGYPLRRLERSFGLWGAQTIVALVFAVEHVAGGLPWSRALLGAGVGSLLFGMAAIATRGLAVPIGLHAAWNFGDWMLGGKDSPGVWKVVADEGYQGRSQLVRTIAYLALIGTATLAFWIWHRRTNRIESQG
jgi:membrane protease YdiL (CAAX protease family)